MDLSNSLPRAQLKDKLLRLVRIGALGGLVITATIELATPPATGAPDRRATLRQRAAGVRQQAADQAPQQQPAADDTQVAWGNWHNWHNGFPNGWHNFHNWRNWW